MSVPAIFMLFDFPHALYLRVNHDEYIIFIHLQFSLSLSLSLSLTLDNLIQWNALVQIGQK